MENVILKSHENKRDIAGKETNIRGEMGSVKNKSWVRKVLKTPRKFNNSRGS